MTVDTDIRLSIWLSQEEIAILSFLVASYLDEHSHEGNTLIHGIMRSCSQELGVARARESSSALHLKSLSKALGKADSVPVKLSSLECSCLVRELNLPISIKEKIYG
jgi:hypothetical protein